MLDEPGIACYAREQENDRIQPEGAPSGQTWNNTSNKINNNNIGFNPWNKSISTIHIYIYIIYIMIYIYIIKGE